MAKRILVNQQALSALGAEQLAALLIELAEGDVVLKRRLRMALAGPKQAAHEVRKRLDTIRRAKSFIGWDKTPAIARDLRGQLATITDIVAPEDQTEALALLWQFMALATPLFERADDSNGALGDAFYAGLEALPALAAGMDVMALAEATFQALQDSAYGQYDEIIPRLAEALGPHGLAALKAKVQALDVPAKPEQISASHLKYFIGSALQDIADAEGDVDAFIAQYDATSRTMPGIAADIAARLLAAGRADEALAALDATSRDTAHWPEWHSTRLEVLETLGRLDEAQTQRWQRFKSALSADDLRAYLKRLPDFEDFEVEEKALDYAARFQPLDSALDFLRQWPALERAAALVLQEGNRLNGNAYTVLTPLADALSARYPLAATLARRAMITYALDKARASRYRYAARHLLECESLKAQISDYSTFPSHEDFTRQLRENHGRKVKFWDLVAV